MSSIGKLEALIRQMAKVPAVGEVAECVELARAWVDEKSKQETLKEGVFCLVERNPDTPTIALHVLGVRFVADGTTKENFEAQQTAAMRIAMAVNSVAGTPTENIGAI